MNIKLTLFLLLIMASVSSLAQKSKRTKMYFNKYGEITTGSDSAYFEICNISLSTIDTTFSYYVSNHKLRCERYYRDRQTQGPYKLFNEEGILIEESRFVDSRMVGFATYYYPNGSIRMVLEYPDKSGDFNRDPSLDYKIIEARDSSGLQQIKAGQGMGTLYTKVNGRQIITETGLVKDGYREGLWVGDVDGEKFEEQYDNHKLLKGTAFPNGNKVKYEKLETPAEFPGGMSNLYKYLSTNIRFPSDARRSGVDGKVFLQFLIGKDGNLSDIKIVKSVSESLDNEALRLVRGMPKWTPGTKHGLSISQKYTLPIVYKLER